MDDYKSELRKPGGRRWVSRWLGRCGLGLAGLLMLGVAPAWAWGPTGHRLVAQIAEYHLEPPARQYLQSEFNITHLQDVANWADQIKKKRSETRSWHYTNIAEGELTYSRLRDCPQGTCVTEIIPEMASRVGDSSQPRKNRREALKFLVHFVADVHQPVHLGNAVDRGGNEIALRWQGQPSNLHALWDSGLIFLEQKSINRYARTLAGGVDPIQLKRWGSSNVVQWSNESRKLALEEAYPLDLIEGKPSVAYVRKGREIVRVQLQKAGVRLAGMLNRILHR